MRMEIKVLVPLRMDIPRIPKVCFKVGEDLQLLIENPKGIYTP